MTYEISYMPKKEHYLQHDLVTLEVTEHEAKRAWDGIKADKCWFKQVRKGRTIVKLIDYRRCKGCLTHLSYCTCEVHKGGAVLIDGGELKRSQACIDWIASVQPRKAVLV